jgi:hypothetical protein
MVNEESKDEKKGVSLDWLIGGVLSKIGDTFDRFTGRNWNPSSNLATSKLVEKLKLLLDSEVRDLGKEGRFVPHVFKLKIQWNKFSTDSDDELKKLEHELHAAAIDHINDRLYHTYAPLEISVVKDYFVEGVQFAAGFGPFAETPDDEREVHITLANIPAGETPAVDEEEPGPVVAVDEDPPGAFVLEFEVAGRRFEKRLDFAEKRRFGIGRSAGNDIVIDHVSVSKSHAAIALSGGGKFVVADTGSTNGTFVSGVRIAYGKATEIGESSVLKFGDVEARFAAAEAQEPERRGPDHAGSDGSVANAAGGGEEPGPTVASIDIGPPTDSESTNDDWEI